MTPEQALTLITSVLKQVQLRWDDLVKVMQAVEVIQKALNENK